MDERRRGLLVGHGLRSITVNGHHGREVSTYVVHEWLLSKPDTLYLAGESHAEVRFTMSKQGPRYLWPGVASHQLYFLLSGAHSSCRSEFVTDAEEYDGVSASLRWRAGGQQEALFAGFGRMRSASDKFLMKNSI